MDSTDGAVQRLVTCGHVVDAFVSDPGKLIVCFPLSGNRYPVQAIKLHPSFARLPDQLVKFDAAVLAVSVSGAETKARPLPIVYEHTLPNQLALTAVRYPVHLGQLSSAVNPLAQMGRLLGPLRKNDDFHLLHDLALSPGDSGAPIFGYNSVVAIHCGDTATLPGLNLPTTSIRLCLWVDALKELNVPGTTVQMHEKRQPQSVKFALAFALSLILALAYLVYPSLSSMQTDAPKIKPLKIVFNKARNGYMNKEPVEMSVKPGSDSLLYIFIEDTDHSIYRLWPQDSAGKLAYVKAGESISINNLGSQRLCVDLKPNKLHLFALINSLPPLKLGPVMKVDPETKGFKFLDNKPTLLEAQNLKNSNPEDVLYVVMDGPVADSKLGEYKDKQ